MEPRESLAREIHGMSRRHDRDWTWETVPESVRETCRRSAQAVLESTWHRELRDQARLAKSDALREAANDMQIALVDNMVPHEVPQRAVIDYLRKRATWIEARRVGDLPEPPSACGLPTCRICGGSR